jgi:ankyrin repeat protein
MEHVHAAQQNDLEALEQLGMSDHHGMIIRDAGGVSIALHALYNGNRTLAYTIAQRCQHIDPYTAAALDDVATVKKYLHQHPENVNTCNGDGFHMLGLACFFNAPSVVPVLLAAGADPAAPSQNDFAVAPIHSATAADSLSIVTQLIAAGADVNAAQTGGFVALHSAAQHGNTEIVSLLLHAGAHLAAATDDGKTARDFAIAGNHPAVVALLTPA